MSSVKKRYFLSVIYSLSFLCGICQACTGLQITTKDGAVVCARTMEFLVDMKSDVIAIAQGKKFEGTLPNHQKGMAWKAKYAIVGANAFSVDHILDGINEKGLEFGAFYFPRFVGYQMVKSANEHKKALAPWELGTWLLSTFSTVDEVKKALPDIKVVAVPLAEIGVSFLPNKNYVPPLHYIVRDAAGNCIVIEYEKGALHIYDNPLGAITNAPSFDWHIINLENYINITAMNVPLMEIGPIKLQQLGHGSGMLGLPGDFTPPSRFIRAVAFSQTAKQVATADEGVNLAINIINNINIPRGVTREKPLDGETGYEFTQWVTVADLKNLRFYYRTYDNHNYRFVDMNKIDLRSGKVKRVPMQEKAVYEDVTKKMK